MRSINAAPDVKLFAVKLGTEFEDMYIVGGEVVGNSAVDIVDLREVPGLL